MHAAIEDKSEEVSEQVKLLTLETNKILSGMEALENTQLSDSKAQLDLVMKKITNLQSQATPLRFKKQLALHKVCQVL